jgi:hypothetical protein
MCFPFHPWGSGKKMKNTFHPWAERLASCFRLAPTSESKRGGKDCWKTKQTILKK